MRYSLKDWPDAVFTSGQGVPAGRYLRVDVAGHQVVMLSHEGVLPASPDGRVAQYVRLADPEWLEWWWIPSENAPSSN